MDRISIPITFAGWSIDEDNRYQSTSGGAFSELAKTVLNQGGIVVGAQYDENNMVEHTIIEQESDLWRIRQSKYISSNLKDIFRQIKQKLNDGMLVCFCGAPCQVAGLYAYLKEEPDNLVTIDFICRGMNSPKALRAWLDEIEEKEQSRINRVWFKYKEGGWKSSPRRVRLDFEDGHYLVVDGDNNLFMAGYLEANLYIRPSCGNCYFKGNSRKSDITLADFWGIEKELDDDKGTSLIMLNSEKGMGLFQESNHKMKYVEKDFCSIFGGNPMFSDSVSVSKRAHAFLTDLDTMPFSKAIKKQRRKHRVVQFVIKVLRNTVLVRK